MGVEKGVPRWPFWPQNVQFTCFSSANRLRKQSSLQDEWQIKNEDLEEEQEQANDRKQTQHWAAGCPGENAFSGSFSTAKQKEIPGTLAGK